MSGTKSASASLPRTRAERTSYAETSTYADVITFIDSLQLDNVPFVRQELGRTTEGRVLPLLVLSRPQVSTPEQARALNRPIVYVQANIHAGEVEGKEALLALVRDLSAARNNVLDSIVLIAIPIYNADSNERFKPQAVNRTEQNGPELVGQRPNAQMLDLNRDYVKAEASETRASLAAFERWNPDVFVDLHTTDGSFHGYALTYSPSLSPAALESGAYTRDSLLPELRRRMQARDGFAVFDYGNFDTQYEERDITDTVKSGWFTYDHRPRFGTNYFGLRQRISILSEAYSHDPFERRVKVTYAFVRELLSLAAERGARIRAIESAADSALVHGRFDAPVPIVSRLTTAPLELPVTFEVMAHTGDSSLTQPGVPRGFRRTGVMRTQRMKVYDRFEPVVSRTIPRAWLLPESDTAAVALLRLHGIRVECSAAGMTSARVSRFIIDSLRNEPREFQGHHEMHVSGRWRDTTTQLPPGLLIVRGDQAQAIAALYLLDPESDDGLVTWNVFDRELAAGKAFPVWRVIAEPGASP
ncbi:MAG: succinylglutamate desuccinylase/aspartoacylase family protein [Gemmatimonadaceae bacterium]|nr:succinylglutamate desuccinylase/aspartoacylase family protein [Gemmatimonadaceae bacterium]